LSENTCFLQRLITKGFSHKLDTGKFHDFITYQNSKKYFTSNRSSGQVGAQTAFSWRYLLKAHNSSLQESSTVTSKSKMWAF